MINWEKLISKRGNIPWVLLVAALGYIIFLQQCRKPEVIEVEVEKIDSIITTTIEKDTVYVDVPLEKQVIKYIPVHLPPKEEKEDFDNDCPCLYDFTESYHGKVTDDTATISYDVWTYGVMKDIKLGYTINKMPTVTITKNIIVEVPKKIKVPVTGLYAGMDIGVSKEGVDQVNLMLELCTKKGFNYELGYNVLGQAVVIGMRTKLSLQFLNKENREARKMLRSSRRSK